MIVLEKEDRRFHHKPPGRTTKSSHLVFDGLDLSVDGTGFVAVGSYTSMSKGQATVGDSTPHTPGMAGRG